MLLSSTHWARIATTLSLASIFAASITLASPSLRRQPVKSAAIKAIPRYFAPNQRRTVDRVTTPAAGSIMVNSTADVTNPLDGLCTLREAITAANTDKASGAGAGECAAGSGDDTITFSVTGTISLTSALPDIASNILLNGPGANLLTIQRSPASFTPDFRIFKVTVASPGAVTFSGLTISNGKVFGDGGGILNVNAAIVNVTNSTLSGNFVDGNGGAIFNDSGTVNVTHSTLSQNTASHPTTGALIRGSGGGIFNGSGTVNVANSTLNQNSAFPIMSSDGGGGIFNSGAGTVSIVNSTLSNNSALPLTSAFSQYGFGGGIANMGAGGISIVNSTLSNNSAIYGGGGGIGNAGTGVISITNSTLSNNAGDATGGIRNASFDGGPLPPPLRIRNSIVAQNTDTTGCPDVSGLFTSQGHNFIGNAGCSASQFPKGVNGDQIGNGGSLTINARLGSLANNGGPTQTLALLPGSPAIDAGDNCVTQAAHCGDANLSQITTDQRGPGFNRALDGNGDGTATVDIGAYESHGGFSITATSGSPQSAATTASFSAPLVATVNSAFGEPVAGGVVTFLAPASGPSAKFTGGVTPIVATLNASRQVSVTPTANGIVGGPYNVIAGGNGIANTVTFSLTNTQAPPTPTPTPIPRLVLDASGPASDQLVALDSVLFLRDPFQVINPANMLAQASDRNTRLVIFATNLQLAQGETSSAVIVNLIDSNNKSYDIPAEDVRLVPNFDLTQVIFRLPNGLIAGTCRVWLVAHSQVSNSGTIRIRD
jgi:CSLREA domain-containing protein